MKKEIKIHLDKLDTAEKQILRQGGQFVKKTESHFTYFNQPKGQVLKITQNRHGVFLTRIENDGQQFKFIGNEPITELRQTREYLTKKYGQKKELTIIKNVYEISGQTVELCEIKGLGFFLVLVSDEPDEALAKELSGQKEPRIITESFDNI